MAPSRRRRETGVRGELEAPRGPGNRPLPGPLARSVEPSAAPRDDEGPRGPSSSWQDPPYRRQQLRGPRPPRGSDPPLEDGHRLEPGAVQHAAAGCGGRGRAVLPPGAHRDPRVEADWKG